MKRILLNILLLFLTLTLASCGVYNRALGKDKDASQLGADGDYFTVSLVYDGETLPLANDDKLGANALKGMKASWNNGYSYYEAAFDEKGTARIPEVEGVFNILVTGLPSGYTYNPNVYFASNSSPYVDVEIYKIINPSVSGNAGKSTGNPIRITQGGIYSATLQSPTDKIYYLFIPQEIGDFGIESIASTTENLVNPIADIYNANAGGTAYFSHTQDDGGEASTYTKNFKHLVEVNGDEYIGNVFMFGVRATHKNEEYPVTVEFALVKEHEFELGSTATDTMMIPKEIPQDKTSQEFKDYVAWHNDNTANKTLKTPETKVGNGYRYESSRFVYNETDGYWHVDGKDGPILYAAISKRDYWGFLDVSLTHVEDAGNKALTITTSLLEDGVRKTKRENYKLFVQGYDDLARSGYYCIYMPANGTIKLENGYCFCRVPDGEQKLANVNDCASQGLTCLGSCEKCNKDCRACPEEQRNVVGYQDVANKDGYVPVTDELQRFLLKFTISQRYYADGSGWVETNPTRQIDATNEFQWLWCCAYYV
ncbi:MAG: hypothetical protein IJ514_00495 [Clostridia bacterium]|nr:hypothetical protein [Clostridia bacterium]